jgi:spoIIIJ-associated protein
MRPGWRDNSGRHPITNRHSGYRLRRGRSLEETALRLAEKARESRKPVSIGPLNSQERRVVHLILRDEKGIGTASRGRGELKKALISPR